MLAEMACSRGAIELSEIETEGKLLAVITPQCHKSRAYGISPFALPCGKGDDLRGLIGIEASLVIYVTQRSVQTGLCRLSKRSVLILQLALRVLHRAPQDKPYHGHIR